jgi:hypothetical protein
MFKLMQGYSAETSGGLLICLPREKAAAFCKVKFPLNLWLRILKTILNMFL